jgi:hypothetical protein
VDNAQMLDEYALIDGEEMGEYACKVLELYDRVLELYEAYGKSTSIGQEFKLVLDAEILRLLVYYKEHCHIEECTEVIEKKYSRLVWDL